MSSDRYINAPDLSWSDDDAAPDAPRSRVFDDIYFSGDGVAESNHVFIDGNDLSQRFENQRLVSIGELGFGTGLNFLAAWDCWRKTSKPAKAKMRFFSVEAFPLPLEDMARAHRAWPELEPLAKLLRDALPARRRGFHRLELGDDVVLTLYYGEAATGLKTLEGAIDAWFLDGFAPSKNPDMWTKDLFALLAQASAENATFATFTVAGSVREALSEAGFIYNKVEGFGRKKHMLVGSLANKMPTSERRPWFQSKNPKKFRGGERIAIIGAGIAGASLGYALKRAGFSPVIFDAGGPAAGASGNKAGLIMPRLDVDEMPEGRFHVDAYLYTARLVHALQQQSADQFFLPCGVLRRATDDREKTRQKKLIAVNALPPDWLLPESGGLFFPQAGVVDPALFVRTLLGATPVKKEHVAKLSPCDDGWTITTGKGDEFFDAAVIANGIDALQYQQCRTLPLAGSAGQVDYFEKAPAPQRAEVAGAYAAPAPPFNGKDAGLIIGATYEALAGRPEKAPAPTEEHTLANLAAVAQWQPDLTASLASDDSIPRTGIRCVTPDFLPVIGPIPEWGFYSGAYDALRHGRRKKFPPGEMAPGLFILTGLGSRGLVTAPFAAAMIASEMTGEPSPADRGVAEAVHPARFFIRDLKRGPKPA